MQALTAHGELVTVTAAHGWVAMPEEVTDCSVALSLADARMCADKARRAPGLRTPDPIWAARR